MSDSFIQFLSVVDDIVRDHNTTYDNDTDRTYFVLSPYELSCVLSAQKAIEEHLHKVL